MKVVAEVSHKHPIINSSTGRITSYTHSHKGEGRSIGTHTHRNNGAYHILKQKPANMLLRKK